MSSTTDTIKRRGRKKQDVTTPMLKTPLTTFASPVIETDNSENVEANSDIIMFIPVQKETVNDISLIPYNINNYTTEYSSIMASNTGTTIKTISVTDCKAMPIEQYVHTCWHCTYGFNTTPYSIPLKCQIVKNNGTVLIGSAREYQTYGTFCMVECMYQYILDNHFHKKEEIISLMYSYIRDRNGGVDTIEQIVPAGPKELLKKYGGTMTIEEYRNKMKAYYSVCIPPMIHLEHAVTSVSIGKRTSNRVA